jgi:hypothetical protein
MKHKVVRNVCIVWIGLFATLAVPNKSLALSNEAAKQTKVELVRHDEGRHHHRRHHWNNDDRRGWDYWGPGIYFNPFGYDDYNDGYDYYYDNGPVIEFQF